MRLRPVAPLIIHFAKKDTVIGDLLVPAGTGVAVLARPAGVMAGHFEQPEAFRSGRWLGDVKGAHEASALMPFGSGPRICPGRVHALLEMKLLLSMLYRNFDVARVGGEQEVREHFAFAVTPIGVKVRLRRRESARKPYRRCKRRCRREVRSRGEILFEGAGRSNSRTQPAPRPREI
jgi:cytochrome P450